MPWMNFDLEDGKPSIGFSLKPDDAARFINFMAECHAYKEQAQEAGREVKRLERLLKSADGSGVNPSALPERLREAAKQFYNLTLADPEVIIRPPNAVKQEAITKAGQCLRDALTAGVKTVDESKGPT